MLFLFSKLLFVREFHFLMLRHIFRLQLRLLDRHFLELFGPRVWYRGFAAVFKGCGVGHLAGDGLQMPGAFLVKDGKIIKGQKAASAADLPDVEGLFTS